MTLGPILKQSMPSNALQGCIAFFFKSPVCSYRESVHTSGWLKVLRLAWLGSFFNMPGTCCHRVAGIKFLLSGEWLFRLQLKCAHWERGCISQVPSCVSLCWARGRDEARTCFISFFLVISSMLMCSFGARNKLRTFFVVQANPLVIKSRWLKLLKINEAVPIYTFIIDC